MSEKVGSTALVPVSPPSRQVVTWAQVTVLAQSAFESKLYGLSNKAQAVIKIQTGIDMGMTPTEALRHVYVVGAVPSFSAQYIAARVKTSGKYDYKVLARTNERCELEWTENGLVVGRSAWTVEDTKRADLLKPGSNHQKYPRAMNFSRALTEGARVFAPDVLGIGVTAYTPEELGGKPAPEDIPEAEFEVVED